MRADLVIARAAVAHAAWRGAGAVTEEDVRVAARLALPHRRRRDPFDEPGMDDGALDDALREAAEHESPDGPDGDGPGGGGSPTPDPANGPSAQPDDANGPLDQEAEEADATPAPASGSADTSPAGAQPHPPTGANGSSDQPDRASGPFGQDGDPAPAPPPPTPSAPAVSRCRAWARGPPAAAAAPAPTRDGSSGPPTTSRAAPPTSTWPPRSPPPPRTSGPAAAAGPALVLRHGDLRATVREGREGNLVLFAVDASGSMAARARMSAVSGAVLSLLRDAYQRRDKVGLVTFRAHGAELVLPPTSSVPAAQARMASMRTGGRTPLADGLLRAREVLRVERLRDPRRRALLVLLTDGRATVGRSGAGRVGDPVTDACRAAALLAADGVATVVVDCESGPVRLGLAARVAAAAGGEIVTIGALSVDGVTGVVRAARAA